MNLKMIRRSIAGSFATGQNGGERSGKTWRALWLWQEKIVRAVERFLSMLFGDWLGQRFEKSGRAGSETRPTNSPPSYRSPAYIHTYNMSGRLDAGRVQYRPDDAVVEELDGRFQFVELTALPSVTRRNRLLLLFSIRHSEKLLAHHFCRRHYLYYN